MGLDKIINLNNFLTLAVWVASSAFIIETMNEIGFDLRMDHEIGVFVIMLLCVLVARRILLG